MGNTLPSPSQTRPMNEACKLYPHRIHRPRFRTRFPPTTNQRTCPSRRSFTRSLARYNLAAPTLLPVRLLNKIPWDQAIDLGLDVLISLEPNQPHTQEHIAAYIEAARLVLNLPTRSFDQRHLWHLEQRCLRKLRKATKARSYHNFISLSQELRNAD